MVEEMHVPWVDTAAGLTNAADYLPENGHWSPAGNRHVGEALAKKWIPLLGPPVSAATTAAHSGNAPPCDSTNASSFFNE
jgi:hypothetical protein